MVGIPASVAIRQFAAIHRHEERLEAMQTDLHRMVAGLSEAEFEIYVKATRGL